jgi:hypothetical protein
MLTNVTVGASVSVNRIGDTFAAFNSHFGGNLTADGARTAILTGNQVGGNLTVNHYNRAFLGNNLIKGKLSCSGNGDGTEGGANFAKMGMFGQCAGTQPGGTNTR